MGNLTLLDVAEWIQKVGIYGMLILALYGGSKKDPWWVFGWQYAAKERECDAWKTLALKGLTVAERIATP